MRDLSWFSALNSNRYHKTERTLKDIYSGFSPVFRVLFWLFALLLISSVTAMLIKVSDAFMVAVPAKGGSLTEGAIGSPRFINPLLATTDADRDLTMLVYAGLLRPGENGALEGALAKDYSVSGDGLVYTFTIRDDAVFHDGKPVTAADVVFTITLAQHPSVKSPKRANFEGVSVHAEGEKTVVFTLPKPYSPFLENTTIGILPRHIWQAVDPEQFAFSAFNMEPIGAGPFEVTDATYNSAGIPTALTLHAFPLYVLGEPYLRHMTVRFYGGEDELASAWENGEIESVSGLSPSTQSRLITEHDTLYSRAPLPRVFGVFWNQSNRPVLTHTEIRKALSIAAPRDLIIQKALGGFATPLKGPFPSEESSVLPPQSGDIAAAAELLERNGWTKGEDGIYTKKTKTENERLAFSLAVPNTPELRTAGEALAEAWQLLGAEVDLKVFESSDISQAVIRPREYDALLFGIVVGRELDLYAFWHSSQRNDPGLNIALYANITTDKLLEEARAATDPTVISEKNDAFAKEIEADAPAVFLYTPDFLYFYPKDLEGVSTESIASPSERFALVQNWYRKREFVWKIFSE